MGKNDQRKTNKAKDEPVAPASKPENERKAERKNPKAPPRINKPRAEKRKSEIEQPASEAAPSKSPPPIGGETLSFGETKSEPDSYRVKHPASEIQTKSEIENPKSEINMEVHHHPQLEHKPKPFKEYLLEGFMIFIAVMMGFIAENIREAIDNNEQARHLTLQLVQDLKADTTQLNEIYHGETRIVKYNDTLFNLLQQPLGKADTRRIQKLAANSHSMWLFHPSAGAIAAIKNQVHLKQFSNSEIIRYFAGYERHIELLHTDQDINLQYQRIYLDPFITQHFTPANMVASFDSLSMPAPQMRNLSQGDLDQLAADMVLIRIITKEMVTDNRLVKDDATRMLQYVIRQYHLEGE